MTRTTILLSLSILLTAPALACGMYVPDHGSQLAAMQDLMSIDAGSSEAVGDLRNPFAIEDLYFDELVVAGVDAATLRPTPGLAPRASAIGERTNVSHGAIGNVVGVVRAPIQRSAVVTPPVVSPPVVSAPVVSAPAVVSAPVASATPVGASEPLRDPPARPVRPAGADVAPRVGPVEPPTPSRLERVRSLLESWLQPAAESASLDDTADTGWASE